MSKRYAVIFNNSVENVVIANAEFSIEGRTVIATDSARIRDIFDPISESFATPAPAIPDESEIVNGVQAWLDQQAQAKGYDSILSAASYATSTNPKFGPEGIAARNGRDATWAYCYEQLGEVEAGTREPPASIDEFLSELTPVAWP